MSTMLEATPIENGGLLDETASEQTSASTSPSMPSQGAKAPTTDQPESATHDALTVKSIEAEEGEMSSTLKRVVDHPSGIEVEIVAQLAPKEDVSAAPISQPAAQINATASEDDVAILEAPPLAAPAQAFPSLIDEDEIDGFLILSATSPEILEADLKRKREVARKEAANKLDERKKVKKAKNVWPAVQTPDSPGPLSTGMSIPTLEENTEVIVIREAGPTGRYFRFFVTNGKDLVSLTPSKSSCLFFFLFFFISSFFLSVFFSLSRRCL